MEQEKRVQVSTDGLNVFLNEAVRLYEYLIDQLHGMLIDNCLDSADGGGRSWPGNGKGSAMVTTSTGLGGSVSITAAWNSALS